MTGAAPSEDAASHGKDSRLGGNVFDSGNVFDFGVTKAADNSDVQANGADHADEGR